VAPVPTEVTNTPTVALQTGSHLTIDNLPASQPVSGNVTVSPVSRSTFVVTNADVTQVLFDSASPAETVDVNVAAYGHVRVSANIFCDDPTNTAAINVFSGYSFHGLGPGEPCDGHQPVVRCAGWPNTACHRLPVRSTVSWTQTRVSAPRALSAVNQQAKRLREARAGEPDLDVPCQDVVVGPGELPGACLDRVQRQHVEV
jgi:hypothetical protein